MLLTDGDTEHSFGCCCLAECVDCCASLSWVLQWADLSRNLDAFTDGTCEGCHAVNDEHEHFLQNSGSHSTPFQGPIQLAYQIKCPLTDVQVC